MGIAAYLVYAQLTDTRIACATGGCETVQASRYSEILGIPVAVLGLAAYAAIFATVLTAREVAQAAGAAIAVAGTVFSAYLLYVQLAVIDALCQWCLASDTVMAALAAATLLRLLRSAD
jgi:uncharacterized membrane protein